MSNLFKNAKITSCEAFTAMKICSYIEITEPLGAYDACFPMPRFIVNRQTLSKNGWVNWFMCIAMRYQYHFTTMRATVRATGWLSRVNVRVVLL